MLEITAAGGSLILIFQIPGTGRYFNSLIFPLKIPGLGGSVILNFLQMLRAAGY